MMRRFLAGLLFAMIASGDFSVFTARTLPAARAGDLDHSEMPVLVWYHHTTREFAKLVMIAELQRRGFAKAVRWKDGGYQGKASVAMGVMLNVSGYITDDEIIIEKCSGTLAAKALAEITQVLERLFPLGDYRGFDAAPDDSENLEIPEPDPHNVPAIESAEIDPAVAL